MSQNEGQTDRIVRVVAGAILLLIAYSAMTGVWQIVLYVLGGLLTVTGLSGYCLVYKLFGVTTTKK